MRVLPSSFYTESAVALAPKLLGKIVKKGMCTGIIVETEAYGTDPASHAFKITPRSESMRDTYGHWYVYFTYGMHYCANVTCDKGGIGAVLIRAVEPREGIDLMRRRRNVVSRAEAKVSAPGRSAKSYSLLPPLASLTNGPAKFCQAFGITKKENGLRVAGDFAIFDAPLIPKSRIATSPRIGISAGKDLPWRFYIKDNPFVSR